MKEDDKKKNELLSGVDAILKSSGAFEGIPSSERIVGVSKPIVEFFWDYYTRKLK